MLPCDFGAMFVLLMIKTHPSPSLPPNWRSLLWKIVQKERESNKELILMSLQCLLLAATGAQETRISGKPKYGQATMRRATDESSDSHTRHPCMCKTEGENGTDRQAKEMEALQRWCTPGDQVILCVWGAAPPPAAWHQRLCSFQDHSASLAAHSSAVFMLPSQKCRIALLWLWTMQSGGFGCPSHLSETQNTPFFQYVVSCLTRDCVISSWYLWDSHNSLVLAQMLFLSPAAGFPRITDNCV